MIIWLHGFVVAGKQTRLFVFGKKAGMNGVGRKLPKLFPAEALLGVRQEVLVGDIRSEECRVVGVEGDQQPGIEVAPQRVSGKRGTNAGADVGGRIELERNPAAPSIPSISPASWMADSACPIRSDPIDSASRMASGPVVSPAWLVSRRPASRAWA